MTERRQRAVAMAERLSREEQHTVAEVMLDQIAAEQRRQGLLSDPRSAPLLERLAAETIAEDDAGRTRDLDEVL